MKRTPVVPLLALAAVVAACDQGPVAPEMELELGPQFSHLVLDYPMAPRAEALWVCKVGPAGPVGGYRFTTSEPAGNITNFFAATNEFFVDPGKCLHIAFGSPQAPAGSASLTVTEDETALPPGVAFGSISVDGTAGNPVNTAPRGTSGVNVQFALDPGGPGGAPPSGAVVTFTNVVVSINGCTPGYWKQPHHFGSWVGYAPGQAFSSVFENAFPGKSLLQVLSQGGGGLNALGRHVVAALLNASNPAVGYPYSTAQVITMFNDLYPAGGTAQQQQQAYNALKDMFAAANEAGCNLGRAVD